MCGMDSTTLKTIRTTHSTRKIFPWDFCYVQLHTFFMDYAKVFYIFKNIVFCRNRFGRCSLARFCRCCGTQLCGTPSAFSSATRRCAASFFQIFPNANILHFITYSRSLPFCMLSKVAQFPISQQLRQKIWDNDLCWQCEVRKSAEDNHRS